MRKHIRLLFATVFVVSAWRLSACQCPTTKLGLDECRKYELIFRGTVVDVADCAGKPGEAVFEVLELYKGNATKKFKVLFECGGECSAKFRVGEEWIIYSRYKQMENALMDWCSRSRKYFRFANEDYYTVTYGNDYDDELQFLRKELGQHRLLADAPQRSEQRNIRPTNQELLITLLCSLGAIILFYYLFNKFFR